jgi:tRNA nucleotidyltransferase (CCA-adding enzyme)
MQTYLVGGAVRDTLLEVPVKDRDWVVTGTTPQHMLALGFQQVGQDFPVFLHPQTKEEHALARTERKSGKGYTGFVCHSDEHVTLEDDLRRRDLTINAMAMDCDGNLIDPWGGRRDLGERLLRHVSPAFSEDPLRVLRVARFLARFSTLDFRVAPETLALMQDMVDAGELAHLTPERVWQETARALCEPDPAAYFTCLRSCGALAVILPELDALWGVPQNERYHPEIDTGVHVMMSLRQGVRLSAANALTDQDRVALLYAILLHDLGKALTPRHEWPAHHGHEAISAHLANKVSERLRVPVICRDLAARVAEYHTHCHRALELRASTAMRTLEALDYLRKPSQTALFLLACRADACGRSGFEDRDYPQADFFEAAAETARRVNAQALQGFGLVGKALGEELRKRRIAAIETVKEDFMHRG